MYQTVEITIFLADGGCRNVYSPILNIHTLPSHKPSLAMNVFIAVKIYHLNRPITSVKHDKKITILVQVVVNPSTSMISPMDQMVNYIVKNVIIISS